MTMASATGSLVAWSNDGAVTVWESAVLVRDSISRRKPSASKVKAAPYYANLKTPARLAHHSTSDPLAGPDWDGTFASADVDYLANDGKALDEAIARDPAVAKKLKDILEVFQGACQKAKGAIESEHAKLKN